MTTKFAETTVRGASSDSTELVPWPTVLCLFGTRPELIKMVPVIAGLEDVGRSRVVTVSSGQHTDLMAPFVRLFGTRIDYDLRVMRVGQTPTQVCSRILADLEPILVGEKPNVILVQGDTTTALAGALAGFYQRIPVGHIEAGLRTGDPLSPYPEETNRRLISRLATYHFAATAGNRDVLLAEGIDPAVVFVTGNPVVDSLHFILNQLTLSPALAGLIDATYRRKRVAITLHRRESFGAVLTRNLESLRRFADGHEDVALIFPVHPNPAVRGPAHAILSGHPRIHLLDPLDYLDFIGLLSQCWLIVSDSGGVQEEAPTLRRPLLILRANTERPEAIECGVARLVGESPGALDEALDQAYRDDHWHQAIANCTNPFGDGTSGLRIAQEISRLCVSTQRLQSER